MGRSRITFFVCLVLLIPLGTASVLGGVHDSIDLSSNISIFASNGHSVIWETMGEPESMDPHISQDKVGKWIRGNIYETLYTYPWDTASNIPTVLLLAADAPSISADGLNYSADLRTGITFHDGTPFNASCVKYNIERIMAIFDLDGPAMDFAEVLLGGPSVLNAVREYGPGSAEHVAAYNNWVTNDSILVLNEFEVRFRLHSPFPYFVYLLAAEGASMISPSFIEANGGISIGSNNSYITTHSSGTGPYQLVDWVPLERVELRQNEDYWRSIDALSVTPYAGDIVNVTIMTTRDNWEVLNQIKYGDSDGGDLPSYVIDQVWNGIGGGSGDGTIKSSDPALKLWVGELMYDTFFLGFNQRPEVETLSYEPILNIFANKSVRQAFSYAFNHSAYIQQVQDGLGEQLLGPVPEGIAAAADFPFYEFNLTAAAEKWNEAMSTGWLETVLDNCSFELHLAYPTGATYAEAAFIILKDGIIEMLTNSSYGAIQPSQPLTINIYALEYGYYQERYVDKGLSVYYFYSHSNYPDPNDSITRIVRSSSSPASRIDLSISDGWNATDLDASISIAAQETYPSDRYDLYQSIQDEISNHSAYLWVSQLPNVHIQKKDMYGYTFIPNRGVYFYHLWKIIRPTITPIMDFELELGTSGSTIDWTVSAESPSNYSIYRNYTKIDSGNWTGTMIQHTIGPLDVGLYNFTLIIWDENSLTATNTVFVTVVDTTGPSATATHVPIQPSNLDEVDVTAFVEDLSTIVNVTLSYSTDLGATWTSIEMTQTGTSTWNAIIPQQSSGSNVAYKIYSQDEYNNQGISSTYLYAVIEATTSPTNTITETTWSSTPTTPTTTGPSGFGDSSILILTLGGTIIGLVFIVFVFVRKTRS